MPLANLPIEPNFIANTQTSQHQQAPWAAKRSVLRSELNAQVQLNNSRDITTSVIVYDETDEKLVYQFNTGYVHWAASDSKLFVTKLLLDDLRAGRVSLSTTLTWSSDYRRDGAGVYDAVGAPTTGTVKDVLFDMLNRSSNTAVRVLVNKVLGGADAVNARYQKDPELKVTRLIPLEGPGEKFYLGYTTATEVDHVLQQLVQRPDRYTAFIANALATNIFNDYGPRSQVQDKKHTIVIDKQGQLNDPEANNRHDVGYMINTRTKHVLRYTLMTSTIEDPAGERTDYAQSSLQFFGKSMLKFEGDSTQAAKPLNDSSINGLRSNTTRPEGRVLY